MKSLWRLVWPPALTVLLVLCLWHVAVLVSGVRPYLLPSPLDVLAALGREGDTLWGATVRTGIATLAGFGLSAFFGVIGGSILASFAPLRRGVYPITNLLQMVPLVAIAPLLTIWFGYGASAVVAAACIVSIFPVIANTVDGLRAVDPKLRELFFLYGAGPWTTWWRLLLPAATPQILTGLRIAAGLSVIGAVVGEFVSGYMGSQAPIGIVILTGIREARTDVVFAAVLLSAAVGFMLFGLVSGVGHLILRRWHPSALER